MVLFTAKYSFCNFLGGSYGAKHSLLPYFTINDETLLSYFY